jgi:hypothetical protein
MAIKREPATGLWFHGDTSKRVNFDGQHMDRGPGQDKNAMGPGIYWTRLRDQARGYATTLGYVYEATMRTVEKRVLRDETRANARVLSAFITAAPEESRYYGLTNWDENPKRALRAAVEAYSRDTMISGLLGIYHDFYGADSSAYARSMVLVGYDALLHTLPETHHLVVYNPAIIQVVREVAA